MQVLDQVSTLDLMNTLSAGGYTLNSYELLDPYLDNSDMGNF